MDVLPVTPELHRFDFCWELDLDDGLLLQVVPDHHWSVATVKAPVKKRDSKQNKNTKTQTVNCELVSIGLKVLTEMSFSAGLHTDLHSFILIPTSSAAASGIWHMKSKSLTEGYWNSFDGIQTVKTN